MTISASLTWRSLPALLLWVCLKNLNQDLTHNFHLPCFLLSQFTSHFPFHSNPSDLCSHIFCLTLILQLSLKRMSHTYCFWHRSSCCISFWSSSCRTADICIYSVRTIDLGNISSAFLEECVSRQFLSPCWSKIHYICCFPLIHYANCTGRQGHKIGLTSSVLNILKWALFYHLAVFWCFSIDCLRVCSRIFLGIEVNCSVILWIPPPHPRSPSF